VSLVDFPGRRVRTPVVLQMEAAECGAAALGIVLAHYGRPAPLEELRHACGVSRDGSKASQILQAARRYGLTARGARCETAGLAGLRLPVIIFWEFNHFVVFEGCNRRATRFFLNDPAGGRRSVTAEEFEAGFTGVVLRLEPDRSFTRRPVLPPAGDYLRRALTGAPLLWAFAGACGLLLVLPTLAVPALIRIFVDDYYIGGEGTWLAGLTGGLVLASLLLMGATGLRNRALLRWQLRAGAGETSRLQDRLLRVPLWWMDGRHPDEMARRAALPEENARLVAEKLAPTVLDLPVLAGLAAFLFFCDPLLAAIVVLLVLPGVWPAWSRSGEVIPGALVHAEAALAGAAIQGLIDAENFKCGGSAALLRKLDGLRDLIFREWQRAGAARHARMTWQDLLSSLALTVVLAGGGARCLAGDLTAGTVAAMAVLTMQAGRMLQDWRAFPAVFQRLQDNCGKLSDVPEEPAGEEPSERVFEKLEVRNLVFGHARFSEPQVKDLTFTVRRGRHLALVGASGSGKSTLLKILAGLQEPWSGRVLLNDEPVTPARFALCGALVEAQPFFPAGRLEAGLAEKDRENLFPAMELAGMAGVVAARPEGPGGPIGPHGENFSRGEAQRLELARVLAAGPGLLLLDESLSSVDSAEAVRILQSVRLTGCAVIHVTHDPAVLALADEIFVIESGGIAERGAFSDLSRRSVLFREVTGL
jgi:ABC-type bacteriocin/lantibiotic exporter with double-glycine peptidase domain